MKNERGEITIDGFYDNVQPLTELERQALAKLPINVDEIKQSLGLQYLDAPQERDYFERLVAWPTLTINGIHGGYGGPGSKTVLPREAIAKCDIRLVEEQTCEEILAKIKAHVQRHAPEVSVTSYAGMDPSKTPLIRLLPSPYARLLLLPRVLRRCSYPPREPVCLTMFSPKPWAFPLLAFPTPMLMSPTMLPTRIWRSHASLWGSKLVLPCFPIWGRCQLVICRDKRELVQFLS